MAEGPRRGGGGREAAGMGQVEVKRWNNPGGSGSITPVLILSTVTTTERKRRLNSPSYYLPIAAQVCTTGSRGRTS